MNVKKSIWIGLILVLGAATLWWFGRSQRERDRGPTFLDEAMTLETASEQLDLSPPSAPTAPPQPVLATAPTATPAVIGAVTEERDESPQPRPTRSFRPRGGPYRIQGTVISIAQAPIEGATVVCRSGEFRDGRGQEEVRVTTGPGGRFLILLAEAGRYNLTAHKAPYARGSAQAEFQWPGEEEVEIVLRPGDTIYGSVFENFTGRALAGVAVRAGAWERLYGEDEMRPQRWIGVITAEDGSYRLEGLLPEQPYTLFVSDSEHAPERKSSVLSGSGPVNFYLNPGARLSGHVLWEEDRSPVEGATVQVGMGFGMRGMGRRGRFAGGPRLASATSDASGFFSLGGLPGGMRLPVFASVQDEEELTYRSAPQWCELSAGQEQEGVELLVARRAAQRLYGVVRDLDRHPVEGASVLLLRRGWRGMGRGGRRGPGRGFPRLTPSQPLDQTLTDEEGAYEFLLSAFGPYQVEVWKEGYSGRAEGPSELMISPRLAEYELNFTLFPGALVQGTVREAETGKAVAKAAVRLRSREREESGRWRRDAPRYEQECETGDDGRFEFTGAIAGDYLLRVTQAPPGYTLPEQGEELTVEGDKPVTHDLLLSRGAAISGRVLYPDGRPASGARLTGYCLEGGRTLTDESDPLGRYRLSAFPVESEVRLLVRPLDFPGLNPAPLLTERMRLEKSLKEFDLQVPEAGSVPCRVVSEEEELLRGQQVHLAYEPADRLEEWDERLGEYFSRRRTTNGEGRADFGSLTPGPWKAWVETLKEPVEVAFGVYSGDNSEVVLVVPTDALVDNSGVLAGTVRFEDDTLAEGAWISARLQSDDQGIEAGTRGSARVDREGHFRIARIRQGGTFRLEVRTRRSVERQEGIVASNRELEFVIPNNGGLTVQVLDEERRPPAGAWTATLFHLEGGRGRFGFQQPEISPAQGTVHWDQLGRGTYQVLVTGAEIARAYSEPVEVEPDRLTEGIEIRLPRPVDFAGEVVDSETLKGIPGVEVIEQFEPGTPGARWSQYQHQRRTFSDSGGDFLLVALPPGPVRLLLKHPAYEEREFEAGEISSGETRIVLQKKPSQEP